MNRALVLLVLQAVCFTLALGGQENRTATRFEVDDETQGSLQSTFASENDCVDEFGNGHVNGEFYGKDGVCEKYFQCVYGEEIEVNCPQDTAFDPAIVTCNYIDLVPGCEHLNGISCTDIYCRDENGFTESQYIDPKTCQAYQCSNGYSMVFNCAPPLAFNDATGYCDHQENFEQCVPDDTATCPGADGPPSLPTTTTQAPSTTTGEVSTTRTTAVPVVFCPSLDPPANGILSYVEIVPRNQVNSIAEFHCNENFELNGEMSIACLSDGSWSERVPECVSTACVKCCQDDTNSNIEKFSSCRDIKAKQTDSLSGMYTLYSAEGESYTTFCDMESSEGGWTLVASIHENDMNGKCTEGDRWSSEEGVVERHGGQTLWENNQVYGTADQAANDDYKNQGYFEIDAEQLMVIQVPNGKSSDEFISSASFQYTSDAFLQEYGGNLHGLFKQYPIIDRFYHKNRDDGPSIPITFLKGSARDAFHQYGHDMQTEMEGGFMQFRAVNKEHGATAFCPYGRMRGGWGSSSTEHGCFGATIADVKACGDFSAFDGVFHDIGWLNNWATSREMRESVFLILYR